MAFRKTIWTYVFASGALAALAAVSASANTKFAKDTGKSCTACHQNSKASPKLLTPLGAQFKADGNKMPAKTDDKAPEKTTP